MKCEVVKREVVNRFLIEKTDSNDVIISEGGYINDAYLRLFSKAHVERGAVMDAGRLAELYDEASHGRLLVSSWAFKPPAILHKQLQNYDPAIVKSYFQQFHLKTVETNAYQTVYQVER